MYKSKLDYRSSHIDPKTVENYENSVYGKHSSYSRIWELEKGILLDIFKKNNLSNNEITYLDFACGTGRVISFLEDKVARATGIDVSQNMINLAKPKVHRSKFIVGDLITNGSLLQQQYNLITAFRFFLNAQPILREQAMEVLARKLASRGLLIFNIHGNTLSYRFPIVMLYRLFGKRLQQMTYFQARNLAIRNGLKISDYYGTGYIPKFLYPLFPHSFIAAFEKLISKTFLKFFCLDMIFVCEKDDK
ncbi:MAG: methyltransferase type 12 [uncultured bacterium]|nr:MAG: methyltransferase type 12 [uncultured bacterium]